MKPYRLINSLELQKLTGSIQELLAQWNDQYSLTPLTMELSLPPKDHIPKEQYLIVLDDIPLASINQDHLNILNLTLFGVDKPCFDAASQELMLLFINQLLQTDRCVLSEKSCSINDWFYRGSTSLLLNLHNAAHYFTLTLHPDWVYQNISDSQTLSNNLKSLDDALANHHLSLSLELDSIMLPLQQLAELKIGDVIATEHSIKTPIGLKQQDQVVAHAELGQSSHYKSIILKRFS